MYKKFSLSLLVVSLLACCAVLSSCDEEDVYSTVDGKIQKFVSQYFPGEPIQSKTVMADGNIQVEVKNSATILFDKEGAWISVEGNGVVLPAVMVYDQLPAKLYNYIEEMEYTDNVYRIYRNSTIYVVEFLDSTVQYVISSGEISYVTDTGTIG